MSAPPTMPEDAHRTPKPQVLGYVLTVLGALMLTLLVAAAVIFRRQYTPEEKMMAMAAQRQAPTFLERLLDTGRFMPQRRQAPVQAEGGQAATAARGSAATVSSDEQLALRETVLTQQILHDRYGQSLENAWTTIRACPATGDFRAYEERRFVRELLWHEFEEPAERAGLEPDLRAASRLVAAEPQVFFEDILFDALADVFYGDAAVAVSKLEHALSIWPAEGRMKGNVYLALMIAYAATDQGARVIEMLGPFRYRYPDWLYVETYMEDLEELQKVYPDAALLWVIRGRLVQYVNDFGAAHAAYAEAAAGELSSPVRARLAKWQHEVERAQ
jgi:hypothetical protein